MRVYSYHRSYKLALNYRSADKEIYKRGTSLARRSKMHSTLRRVLEERGAVPAAVQPLDTPSTVSADPLQSTDSSSSVSIGSNMSFNDYLVLGVSAVMILACIVMVYFFTASRNLKYGEDKALLEEEQKKSKKKKKKSRAQAAGAGHGTEEEGVPSSGSGKPKKSSDRTTKKLKSKMKKRPQGILNTVMEEHDVISQGDGPGGPGEVEAMEGRLEGLNSASGAGADRTKAGSSTTSGKYEASSDSGSGSDKYSSAASSVHDEMLKQTLLTVLAGGLTLLQHRANAEPKAIILFIDGTILRWKGKRFIARNTYTMDLARVRSIEWGKHAVAFAKFSASEVHDDVCFSLVTDDQVSLDLQCSSKTERDTLVHGISLVVSDARGAGAGDASERV